MAMECVFQVHDWIYWSGKFDLYERNFGPVLHLCARFIRSGLHNLFIQIHVNLQIDSSTNFKIAIHSYENYKIVCQFAVESRNSARLRGLCWL